ncbi:MAG: hypothetical protein LWX56_14830 [Ignavibacteria bacterium]|nr:hypothetical protein [Ignavibacteria bacterium]
MTEQLSPSTMQLPEKIVIDKSPSSYYLIAQIGIGERHGEDWKEKLSHSYGMGMNCKLVGGYVINKKYTTALEIGYLESTEYANISGSVPYWEPKIGLNFSEFNSSFMFFVNIGMPIAYPKMYLDYYAEKIYSIEFSRNAEIGFEAELGCNIYITKPVSVIISTSILTLNQRPQTMKYTKYQVNGKSILDTMPNGEIPAGDYLDKIFENGKIKFDNISLKVGAQYSF